MIMPIPARAATAGAAADSDSSSMTINDAISISSTIPKPANTSNQDDEDLKKMKRRRLVALLKQAAAAEAEKGDPWAKHEMHIKVPAERVVRHLYHYYSSSSQRSSGYWTSEETIVKMERQPFTHGAMRFCYRLKKRTALPESATNHRFHQHGWARCACNYVAKTYHTTNNNHGQMEIDTSDAAKEAVRSDVSLQYEAVHWAERFNARNPPKQIIFIRTYALEFPDRPGQPWFAVERYISGTDIYGCGFVKHNTNSGFVDEELHRVTPQVFSAFTFYESHGERLVADIQGVGDLYTDPQVLSSDYRFGDGDLGPRGMALFFHSFRHNTLANSMGIPVFPLSKNELKRQAKYDYDDADDCSLTSAGDDSSFREAFKHLDRFAAMDLNRSRRMTMAAVPPREIIPDDLRDTEKRSNAVVVTTAVAPVPSCRDDVRNSLRHSSNQCKKSFAGLAKPKFARHASDINEVKLCLDLAKKDYTFDNRAYHRLASGEMPEEKMNAAARPTSRHRSSLTFRTVSEPMAVHDKTRDNLGKVHYQLAVLHGMGRFPDDVPKAHDIDDDKGDAPAHDVFSVLFHLAHAASLQNVAACLALGRLHAGLPSCVSNLLPSIVPIDFDTAKDLLTRAMQSEHPSPACCKVAAGCLLYHIYMDERDCDHTDDDDDETGTTASDKASDVTIMHLLDELLHLMTEAEAEKNALVQHKKKKKVGSGIHYHAGDRVEGNYSLEGNYYPGVVESVAEDGQSIVVKYNDDGSTESLSLEHVRLIVPPTATATALGGPLSDEQSFGEADDAACFVDICELRAELAGLKEKSGNKAAAAALYEEASNEAMQCSNKMKKAAEWSMKAAALME